MQCYACACPKESTATSWERLRDTTGESAKRQKKSGIRLTGLAEPLSKGVFESISLESLIGGAVGAGGGYLYDRDQRGR